MTNTEELGLEVFVEGWRRFEQIMDRLDDSIDKTAKSMEKTGSIAGGAFAVALGTIAVNAAMALGRALLDAGRAVFEFGAESLQMAADFQGQMAILEIAASSTGLSFDQLHDAALQVGGDTRLMGVSATGAADAMTGLFKAGLSNVEVFGDLQGFMDGTAELGGALRASIDLAAASELDMVQASDLAAVALASFGAELETETERADFINDALNNMVQAADASVAEVEDLAAALIEVGPGASAAGVSIQDTNNALALLSTRGIAGSRAGTALDAMFRSLTDATPQATDALEALGIEIFDLEGNMNSTVDIIGQFESALGDATDAERENALGTIFTANGKRAMNTLLATGVEGWDAMAAATANAAGIQEQAAARSQTFNAQMEALEGTVETLKIGIGEQFLPVAQELAVWAGEMVSQHGPALQAIFTAIAGAVSQFVGVLMSGQGVFAAVVEILDDFLPDEIIAQIWSFADALSFIRDGLVSGGLPDALLRIQFIIQETFGMDAAQRFNSLRVFIEETLPEAIEKVLEVFRAIQSWVVTNWPAIQQTVLSAVIAIRDWFVTNWPIIQAAAVTAFEVIKDVVMSVVAVFQESVIPSFQAAFTSLTETLAVLGLDWGDVWEGVKMAVGLAAAVVGAVLLAMVGIITGIVQAVAGTLEFMAETWRLVAENIKLVVEGIAQVLTGWWEFVAGLFTGNQERMTAGFSAFWEGIKNLAIAALQSIVTVFRSTFGIILTFVSEFISGFIGFFENLFQQLVGGSIIPDMMASMLQVFKAGFANITSGIVTAIQGIITTMQGFSSRFIQVGAQLIDGLVAGIKAAAARVAEAAREVVANAVAAAQSALGIESPSKVFFAIGDDLGQGLIDGINSTADGVADAIEGLFGIGGTLGSVGGAVASRLKRLQLDPLTARLKDMRQKLKELREEREKAEAAEIEKFGTILDDRKHLESIRAEANLENEIARASAEQLKLNKQLLALEKQRKDLAFLKQQSDLLDLIREHGLDAGEILGGLELGINASLEGIVQAMSSAMQAIITQVESELEIASPSKVFSRIGQRMMEGLSRGVAQIAPTVQAQLQAVVQAPAMAMAGGGAAGATSNVTNNFNLTTQSTTRPGGLAMEFGRMQFQGAGASR